MVSSDTVFQSCTFDMKPQYYKESSNPTKDYSTDHYALWIHNYGDVVVDDCTFKNAEYGTIKSTWNQYNGGRNDADLTLTVTNSTFDNCGNGGSHRPFHLDGAASVFVAGNTFPNSYTEEVSDETTDYCEHIDIKKSPDGKGVDAVVNSECNPSLYTVIYTDGVDGEEVFADQYYGVIGEEVPTPTFEGTPSRVGYTFKGWSPAVAEIVTEDTTYTAIWEAIAGQTPAAPTAPAAPAPKTGDNTNIALWMALMAVSAVALVGLRKKSKASK